MTLKKLFIIWSIFWTVTLASIGLNNSQRIPQIIANSDEVRGTIVSERRFRNTQNLSNPTGDSEEEWKYEISVRYDNNKIWRVAGTSSAPARGGQPVQLIVSRANPGEVYFKERLLNKANLLTYGFGWLFFVVVPWIFALLLGFVK
jgi:hypothetical protein